MAIRRLDILSLHMGALEVDDVEALRQPYEILEIGERAGAPAALDIGAVRCATAADEIEAAKLEQHVASGIAALNGNGLRRPGQRFENDVPSDPHHAAVLIDQRAGAAIGFACFRQMD